MMTIISEFTLMFALTAMSISFGVASQAAFSKALYCLSLNTIFNINFAVAGLCILAQTNGEMINESEIKRRRLFYIGANSIIISLLVALPLPSLFAFYPEKFISLFSTQNNPDVMKYIDAIVTPIAMESVLKAPNYQLLFQTRPLTGGMFSGILFSIAMLCGLLASILLAFAMNWKTQGLAIGFASAMFFSNLFLYPAWKKDIWNAIEKKSDDSFTCVKNLISAGLYRLSNRSEGEQHNPIELTNA